jgi:hypothetical protein
VTASTQVATLNCTRPRPVWNSLQQNSNHYMDPTKTETVPWPTRASGDRIDFRWAKSGTVKAEWNVILPVSPLGPEIARK